ncbi:hypothetical protein [Agromyces sp. GXS1127]|uniref:hypothetical protein n=1 Tax=Agromyces sp. GXS1127 TaxID=3424181 RepID=UPI003D32203E
MPTLRPRFQVTETPEVERALRAAARAWPGAGRAELVSHIFERAAATLEQEERDRAGEWRATVDLTEGALDVAYEPGYLENLRAEWPE